MGFKIKTIALALAIVILLNLFVYTGIRTFYKAPDRTKYCGDIYSRGPIYTEQDCVAAGGQWFENTPNPQEAVKPMPNGYCNEKATCYALYNEVLAPYERNIFILYIILGLASLLLGFVLKVDAVSAGFNFGAVILLVTGTIRYWRDMNDYLRFIIVGIALALVIWFGYKKLQK